jgi:hypothetical protein
MLVHRSDSNTALNTTAGRSRVTARSAALIALVTAAALGAVAGPAQAVPLGKCDGPCSKPPPPSNPRGDRVGCDDCRTPPPPRQKLVSVYRNTYAYSTPYLNARSRHALRPATYVVTCEANSGSRGRHSNPWWSRLREGTWVNNGDLRGGAEMGIGNCSAPPNDGQPRGGRVGCDDCKPPAPAPGGPRGRVGCDDCSVPSPNPPPALPPFPTADFRPYNVEKPSGRPQSCSPQMYGGAVRCTKPTGDYDVEQQLGLVATGASIKGLHNSANLLRHWLKGSGSTYRIDVRRMVSDLPSFASYLRRYLTTQRTAPVFESGWQATCDGAECGLRPPRAYENESLDWYYALNNFFVRVNGYRVAGGSATYSVTVAKLYNFGSNPGEQARKNFRASCLRDRGTSNPKLCLFDLSQRQIARLHTVGLARDFLVAGTATFSCSRKSDPCNR